MFDLKKDILDMCENNKMHLQTIERIEQENNFLREMFLVQQKMYDELKHEIETLKKDQDFEIESIKNDNQFQKTQVHVVSNQKKELLKRLEFNEMKLEETKEKFQIVEQENKTLRQRILSSSRPESNNPDSPFGSWLVINLKTCNQNLLRENEQSRRDNEHLRQIISDMSQRCAVVSDLTLDKTRLEKQNEKLLIEIQQLNKHIEENSVETKKKKMNIENEKLYSLFSSEITTTFSSSSSSNSSMLRNNGNENHNDQENDFYHDFDFDFDFSNEL